MTTDLLTNVIAYEAGQLDDAETVEFFGDLVQSGLVWQLQGHYGRTAMRLIAEGLLSPEGEVLATI
ncbi:hypothetical protein GCM10028801_36100 [Nocardioides maradonensis]